MLKHFSPITSISYRNSAKFLSAVNHEKKFNKSMLLESINNKREAIFKNDKSINIPPTSVFINNDIGLRYIHYYGFDYDSTLAEYSDQLNRYIYYKVIETLQHNLGYPAELSKFIYNPEFDVKGLHFDLKTGFTIMLNSSNHLCLGTVHRGHEQLSDDEVFKHYNHTHIPTVSFIDGDKKIARFWQSVDKFSSPLMCVLTDLIQLFQQQNRSITPLNVWQDVKESAHLIHVNGSLHKEIMNNIDKYLIKNPKSQEYLNNLVANNKKLFILTNSNFEFLNCGMTFLFGKDWRDLFDIIITSARKPNFYTTEQTYFREIDVKSNNFKWNPISEFKKGSVYSDGNIKTFNKYTKWNAMNILYFGDHLQSDLMEPILMQGWRTAAIISEVEREIDIENNYEYQNNAKWMSQLEVIMRFCYMMNRNEELGDIINSLKEERQKVRKSLKDCYNSRYGSFLRTSRNPTNFMKQLQNYADIYTSSIGNMLQYPLNMTFYSRKFPLPHNVNTIGKCRKSTINS